MLFNKFIAYTFYVFSLSSLTLAQNDEKLDVLVPVGVSGSDTLVIKQTVPLPDLVELYKDPSFRLELYTKENMTDVGLPKNFLDFLETNSTLPEGINCINCDTKNRAVLDLYTLNRCGYCRCGYCLYYNSGCWFDVCRNMWYNCIPDVFKPTPTPSPSKTTSTKSSSLTTTTTTTTTSSSIPGRNTNIISLTPV
ncbi:hypothetical protein AYI69_g4481 [Smittium culicis]|uniref:Uncharacterized protein n=1 Tax=Smittium culicis TaxID=133412 RepID=A0A1R1YD93_9FUNG|nr:hypothetical protein AYI69_g4481 [Smittium culicis]